VWYEYIYRLFIGVLFLNEIHENYFTLPPPPYRFHAPVVLLISRSLAWLVMKPLYPTVCISFDFINYSLCGSYPPALGSVWGCAWSLSLDTSMCRTCGDIDAPCFVGSRRLDIHLVRRISYGQSYGKSVEPRHQSGWRISYDFYLFFNFVHCFIIRGIHCYYY